MARAHPSTLRNILEGGRLADFEFIAGVLDSNVNFTDDLRMHRRLLTYRRAPSERNKQKLIDVLIHEYRYAGSADLAYFGRWLQAREPGVSPDEIVSDVAKRLGVKIRPVSSLESKLRRLTKAVVEREILAMSGEQQQALLRSHGASSDAVRQVRKRLKRHGPVAVLPILLSVVGRETSERLVVGLVVRNIGRVFGRDAAQVLVTRLGARFPWWAHWVGPLAWSMTGALLTLDLHGPAYRKTIPVTLYLGLMVAREHDEPGDV